MLCIRRTSWIRITIPPLRRPPRCPGYGSSASPGRDMFIHFHPFSTYHKYQGCGIQMLSHVGSAIISPSISPSLIWCFNISTHLKHIYIYILCDFRCSWLGISILNMVDYTVYRPYAFETTNRQWHDGMGIIHTMAECLLSLSHTTTKIYEIMKSIEKHWKHN